MWLIWIGVVLMLLHFGGIGPFAALDWWWALPFALAFIWFEFVERPLGLDKKKGLDEMERAKRKRIQKALGDKAPSAQAKSRFRK